MSTLNPKNKRTAMSLAELLLTMTIIGVIASYTIPVVMKNIQDATLRVAWKQGYSILDQASKRIAMDNAGTLKGAWDNNNMYFRDEYKNYLNYIKECAAGASYGVCITANTDIRYLDGSSVGGSFGNNPAIVLSNGMSFAFTSASTTCANNLGPIYFCGAINIDVNGLKGPNIVGRDIFAVYVREFGIQPYGISADAFGNTCSLSGSGLGCAAKFLQNYDLNL